MVELIKLIFDKISNPVTAWIVVGILVIYIVLKDIAKNIPELQKLKAFVLIPIASHIKFKKIQKAAIKSDIQGVVNVAIKGIAHELPENSIKPVEIEYIDQSEPNNFIKENKVFVRIRPVEDQDENFLNVVPYYLELVLLSNSKPLLSKVQRQSISFYTTSRILEGHDRLINKFHDEHYLPCVQIDQNLQTYFDNIQRADKKGLFFSVILRIIENRAGSIRFTKGNLSLEFDDVLTHILNFIRSLKSKQKDSDVWQYIKPGLSFSILLVAAPYKSWSVRPQSYVNRLLKDLVNTNYVFVVFSGDEWNYGKKVVEAIEQNDVTLIETINSTRDYRGKPKGIIKIYSKKNKLDDLSI